MSVMPAVTLEVAFTTDPGDTPSWTDVSAYLREFTINRGRQRELDKYAAGRCSILLDNTDRRFDPIYAASPYYPNVVPMRRVRIRAVYNAVTYDVFNGYADGWKQTYGPPSEAWCELSVTDAFKVLANIELPPSVYAAEVIADSPVHWWRLGEPEGTAVAYDSGSTPVPLAYDGATLGGSGLVTLDPDTAMATTTQTQGAWTQSTSFPTGRPLTVEAVIRGTVAYSGQDQIFGAWGGSGAGTTAVRLMVSHSFGSPDHTLTFDAQTTGGAMAVGQATGTLRDGLPHHVAGVWEADGTLRVYLDGVDVTSGSGSLTTGVLAPDRLIVGAFPDLVGQVGWIGTTDEVAVYDTALSAARVAAHSAASKVAWQNDPTGTRVGRILDAADWPAADRSLDTGLAVLQASGLGGGTLAALQTVEQTEQGRFFVTAAGLVQFVARDSILKAPYTTSQGTFGDSGSELEYAGLEYDYDDQLIWNEAQVSRVGGTIQSASDATSQARYLRRTRVVDGLLHQSDLTSRDLASWIVNHYKDPLLRVTGLTLEPSAGNETTHYPHVLGRELGDRVTVRRKPQNLSPAIDQEAVIEGITHKVTAQSWVTTWNLSPAETQIYWIAGVAGFSEAGQTTRAGF